MHRLCVFDFNVTCKMATLAWGNKLTEQVSGRGGKSRLSSGLAQHLGRSRPFYSYSDTFYTNTWTWFNQPLFTPKRTFAWKLSPFLPLSLVLRLCGSVFSIFPVCYLCVAADACTCGWNGPQSGLTIAPSSQPPSPQTWLKAKAMSVLFNRICYATNIREVWDIFSRSNSSVTSVTQDHFYRINVT